MIRPIDPDGTHRLPVRLPIHDLRAHCAPCSSCTFAGVIVNEIKLTSWMMDGGFEIEIGIAHPHVVVLPLSLHETIKALNAANVLIALHRYTILSQPNHDEKETGRNDVVKCSHWQHIERQRRCFPIDFGHSGFSYNAANVLLFTRTNRSFECVRVKFALFTAAYLSRK